MIILLAYCLTCWAIGFFGFRPWETNTWDAVLMMPLLLPMAAMLLVFVFVL
ncbi:MAG: hypothetical protein ACRC62_37755 [Microcoleus sp.]